MKILQINCVYKKGSTGKIVFDLHRSLRKKNMESVVCYGRGEKLHDPDVHKTCGEVYSKYNNFISRVTGVLYGGCFFSTNKLISVIKKEKPDVVHLHCINGYFVNVYRLVNWLKTNHIPTVLTLHAEFMYTGGCGYSLDCNQWSTEKGCGCSPKCPRLRSDIKSIFFDRTHAMWSKMKKAFDGFGNLTVVSVSPWLMNRAKQSPVLAGKNHTVVMNGLDTDVFKPYDTKTLRTLLGLDNKKIVFHATPNFNNDPNHIKGGHYVLRLAEQLKDENIMFVIAGNHAEDLAVPDNVMLLGNISDQQKLAQLYAMADVTLLTSRQETFSMICAESLCCGTPIVGFKAGAPEQIAIPEYSAFVEYGDVNALKQAVMKRVYKKKEDSISNDAIKTYSKSIMAQHYFDIYKKMI